ncbi:terpenoid synthase [Amylostereum chailletii]|nr:terpenoid synthase [Amylostereum chailletii]
MSQPTHFILPDLVAHSTAFTDATNPHWERAAAESKEWVNSYKVFADRRRAFFLQGQSELLVSHAYPYAAYQEFRTICDFVNLLFVIDEISDEQGAGDARLTGDIFLHVLRDPTWTDGSKVAHITKDFVNRLLVTIKPNTLRRFIDRCQAYIDAVVEEASLRERNEVLDLTAFTILRRENSAVRACFSLIPYALGIDLPDEVINDSVVHRLHLAGVDMVCWANDLYSYNMELSSGLAGNNFVTVLMRTQDMDIQSACDYAGVVYKALMDSFVADKARLPSFGAVDADVLRYVEASQQWAIGNIVWSFETPRYFGANRHEIKKTRMVPLKPVDLEPLADDE